MGSPTSLIFHAFVFLLLASFVQATRTDPGGIPDTPEWRARDQPPAEMHERKRGNPSSTRWCRKSGAYKPDRAHYCRVLQRCALRMDHQCPWLGNTIGFANHKFFYLFLFYATSACGISGLSILDFLVRAAVPQAGSSVLVGAGGLSIVLSSVLGPFLMFHTWLLARNMTTIEFCQALQREQWPGSVYDVGIYNNLRSVLGDNPLLWWLPLGGPSGSGVSFPRQLTLLHDSSTAAERDEDAESVMLDGSPEAAHPAQACEDDVASDAETRDADVVVGNGTCLSSVSDFFVWHSAEEFTDDFRVGYEVIEETCIRALSGIARLCVTRRGCPFSLTAAPRVARVRKHSLRASFNKEISRASDSSGSASGAEFLSA